MTIYAGDYRDFWPLNNPGDDDLNLANPPANYTPKVWAEGREGSNLTDEATADGMVSDRVSLIAPYVKTKQVFRCPGDKHALESQRPVADPAAELWDERLRRLERRALERDAQRATYRIFRKTTDCRRPSVIFILGEIHPNSLCRPMFGINMDSQAIYHFPGNYHGQISDFAFLDGHTEARRWRDSQFNTPTPAPANWHSHTGNKAKPSSLSDLNWLKEHSTYR